MRDPPTRRALCEIEADLGTSLPAAIALAVGRLVVLLDESLPVPCSLCRQLVSLAALNDRSVQRVALLALSHVIDACADVSCVDEIALVAAKCVADDLIAALAVRTLRCVLPRASPEAKQAACAALRNAPSGAFSISAFCALDVASAERTALVVSGGIFGPPSDDCVEELCADRAVDAASRCLVGVARARTSMEFVARLQTVRHAAAAHCGVARCLGASTWPQAFSRFLDQPPSSGKDAAVLAELVYFMRALLPYLDAARWLLVLVVTRDRLVPLLDGFRPHESVECGLLRRATLRLIQSLLASQKHTSSDAERPRGIWEGGTVAAAALTLGFETSLPAILSKQYILGMACGVNRLLATRCLSRCIVVDCAARGACAAEDWLELPNGHYVLRSLATCAIEVPVEYDAPLLSASPHARSLALTHGARKACAEGVRSLANAGAALGTTARRAFEGSPGGRAALFVSSVLHSTRLPGENPK